MTVLDLQLAIEDLASDQIQEICKKFPMSILLASWLAILVSKFFIYNALFDHGKYTYK